MTELENRALAFLQTHTLYDECRDEYYKLTVTEIGLKGLVRCVVGIMTVSLR